MHGAQPVQVAGVGTMPRKMLRDLVHTPQRAAQRLALDQVGGGGVLAGQAREQQGRFARQAVQRHPFAVMNGARYGQAVFIQVVQQLDEERQLFVLALFEQREHHLAALGGHEKRRVFRAACHALKGHQAANIEFFQKRGDLCVAQRSKYSHENLAQVAKPVIVAAWRVSWQRCER